MGTQRLLWMEYVHSALYVLKCYKILEEDQLSALHFPAAEQAVSCVNLSPSLWEYTSECLLHRTAEAFQIIFPMFHMQKKLL